MQYAQIYYRKGRVKQPGRWRRAFHRLLQLMWYNGTFNPKTLSESFS